MKAKCLCGAVEVTAPKIEDAGLCHCSMCRRWTGGPMFTLHCGANVSFNGTAPTRYPSSEWAERGFCASCGTHLFYYLRGEDDYILPAGLFQDEDFQLRSEIFIDEKPAYYEFKNDTHKMTGQEVFEQYSSKK